MYLHRAKKNHAVPSPLRHEHTSREPDACVAMAGPRPPNSPSLCGWQRAGVIHLLLLMHVECRCKGQHVCMGVNTEGGASARGKEMHIGISEMGSTSPTSGCADAHYRRRPASSSAPCQSQVVSTQIRRLSSTSERRTATARRPRQARARRRA